MYKYRVYFHQINATYIDVEARDAASAEKKATALWRIENSFPDLRSVEKKEKVPRKPKKEKFTL